MGGWWCGLSHQRTAGKIGRRIPGSNPLPGVIMRLLRVAACLSVASSLLMAAQPPPAHAQKLDNYGDPLPPGAVLR